MMKPDQIKDFHGYRRIEMLAELERIWARREWHGLRRVYVIHGTGGVLWRELRAWCDEKGIPWTTEEDNPGVTILHPSRRVTPPPAPPHRPLAHLKRHVPAPEKPRKVEEEEDADALMAQEFDRLGKEDGRTIRKRKHSDLD